MNKHNIYFLLIIVSFRLMAQREVDPHVNVGCSVLIQNDSGYSSGFVITDSLYLYLVTSRHTFIGVHKTPFYADFILTNNWMSVTTYNENIKNKDQFQFVIPDLLSIYRQGNLKFDTVHDVVAIRFARYTGRFSFNYLFPVGRTSGLLPPGLSMKKFLKFDSLDIGQPICTVGYPKSLGLQDIPQYNFNYPLLRKGIIAAIDSVNGNIIIDCPCYKGNSGGPVFELVKFATPDNEGTTYSLIGLVSEFIPYREDKYDSTFKVKDTFIWNSGYSIVTPTNYILNLISSFSR